MDIKLAPISDLIEELYNRCKAQEGACLITCIHQGDDLMPPTNPDSIAYLTTTRAGSATRETHEYLIDLTQELLQEVIKAK